MINGNLVEIVDDQYKIQTIDGSIFIFKASEVEKFTKETTSFNGRRADGFGFALEAGLLAGAQHTDYSTPFSFNFLTSITHNVKNIMSLGSGVEFIGKPYTPLFIEYKYLMLDQQATPFVFLRGGALFQIGGEDPDLYDPYYDYNNYNYKGGGSFAFGTGISWAKVDYEAYLSFAYRYAQTSYQRKEYNMGTVTYNNSLNRLEIKFGFKF